jgi:very-short-patch-repair endonuclease
MDDAANARRTQVLELFGYLVLRFPNERVMADLGGVADDIPAVLDPRRCNLSPSHRLRRRAPPSLKERGI